MTYFKYALFICMLLAFGCATPIAPTKKITKGKTTKETSEGGKPPIEPPLKPKGTEKKNKGTKGEGDRPIPDPPKKVPIKPKGPSPKSNFARLVIEKTRDVERRYALLIQVDSYLQNKNWNIPSIANNASLMKESLEKYCLFDGVYVLKGNGTNRANVENYITRVLPSKFQGSKNLFFLYYTGHSYLNKRRQPIFMTKNTYRQQGIYRNIYSYQHLSGWLADMRKKVEKKSKKLQILLVIDACRPSTLAPPSGGSFVLAQDCLVSSCKDYQLSEADPKLGYSYFTKAFCDVIQKGGKTKATIGEIFQKAKEMTIQKSGKAQEPQMTTATFSGKKIVLSDLSIPQLSVEVIDDTTRGKVTGAKIWLGGPSPRLSPADFSALRARTYTLTLEHPGYGWISKKIYLSPDTQKLTLYLVPLNQEETAYHRAVQQGNLESYSRYLVQYPNGSKVKEVFERFSNKLQRMPDLGKALVFPPGTYYFDRDLVIKRGCQVFFQPGAVLKFQKGAGLYIREGASIEVGGTREAPVIFGAKDDDADKKWDGIHITRAKKALFQFLVLQKSTGGLSLLKTKALLVNCRFLKNRKALRLSYSTGTLINCTFEGNDNPQNRGALYSNNSHLRMKNCLFSNNKSSENFSAIYGEYSFIKMEQCVFQSNRGGSYLKDCQSEISNSRFQKNYLSYLGSSVGLELQKGRGVIWNCEFIENKGLYDGQKTGDGLYALRIQGGKHRVFHNLFLKNTRAIAVRNSPSEIFKNFIGQSYVGVSVGGGKTQFSFNVIQQCESTAFEATGGETYFVNNLIDGNGGGILLVSQGERDLCRGVVEKNWITKNGFGIRIVDASPQVLQNHISGNGHKTDKGGGISLEVDPTYKRKGWRKAVIRNNEITANYTVALEDENSNPTKGKGGGIYIESGFLPLVENNYIHHNRSQSESGGIGNYSQGASIVRNCFISNKAPIQPNGDYGKESLSTPKGLKGTVGFFFKTLLSLKKEKVGPAGLSLGPQKELPPSIQKIYQNLTWISWKD